MFLSIVFTFCSMDVWCSWIHKKRISINSLIITMTVTSNLIYRNTLELGIQGSKLLVWPYNPLTSFVTSRKSPILKCLSLIISKMGNICTTWQMLVFPTAPPYHNFCFILCSKKETKSYPGILFSITRKSSFLHRYCFTVLVSDFTIFIYN